MKARLPNRRSRRGQTLVEFALVMPMLLLLVMGVIEFGWLIMNYTQLYNGLREGLRYGAAGTWSGTASYYQCDNIRSRILAFDPTSSWEIPNNGITVEYDDGYFASNHLVGTCPAGGAFTPSGNFSGRPVQAGDRLVISVNVTLQFLTPIIATFAPGGLPVTFTAARSLYPGGVPLCTNC